MPAFGNSNQGSANLSSCPDAAEQNNNGGIVNVSDIRVTFLVFDQILEHWKMDAGSSHMQSCSLHIAWKNMSSSGQY